MVSDLLKSHYRPSTSVSFQATHIVHTPSIGHMQTAIYILHILYNRLCAMLWKSTETVRSNNQSILKAFASLSAQEFINTRKSLFPEVLHNTICKSVFVVPKTDPELAFECISEQQHGAVALP